MISRKEFLGLTAALAAGAAGAAAAQRTPSAAEREAEAGKNTRYKAEKIMAMDEAGLIDILRSENASEFEKAKACQFLAVIGNAKAVPALAALLSHPKLSHYARYGLEPIPEPSVDAAFRKALGQLEGNLRVGVINSIGHRRDAQALEALAPLRHDSDRATAEAAAAAIARIRRP